MCRVNGLCIRHYKLSKITIFVCYYDYITCRSKYLLKLRISPVYGTGISKDHRSKKCEDLTSRYLCRYFDLSLHSYQYAFLNYFSIMFCISIFTFSLNESHRALNPLSMSSPWRFTSSAPMSVNCEDESDRFEDYAFPAGEEDEDEFGRQMPVYPVEWLKARFAKLPPPKPIDCKSSGYVRLLHIVRELQTPLSQARKNPRPGPSPQNKGKSGRKSIQLNVREEKFIPTAFEKNAGLWDEGSERAFQIEVKSLLNKLTADTIPMAIQSLHKWIDQETDNEKRMSMLKFVADNLSVKASEEHAFAGLYATFTKAMGDSLKELQDSVVAQVASEFYILRGKNIRNESESHVACGFAKFYGSLIASGVIPPENAMKVFDDIVNSLEEGVRRKYLSNHIVEMAFVFIKDSGSTFARAVPEELWARVEKVKASGVGTQRLKFMIGDIIEMKQEWVYGQAPTRAIESTPVPEPNLYLVRDALENYKEGEECEIDMPPENFLRAAGEMFPDQTRDPATYCEFVCAAIVKLSIRPRQIVSTLSSVAESFRTTRIESDSPKLWSLFDDLAYALMLHGVLQVSDVRALWRSFPKEHSNDIVNGMKWYLCDNHYFQKSVNLTNFPSNEIRDALMMPDTIDKPMPSGFRMSKLISLAIIRSVCSKVIEADHPSIDQLTRWKPFLRCAMERDSAFFKKEMDSNIVDLDLPFSIGDVMKLLD